MPSTRRRLLAGVATGGAIALAGCAGRLGTSPRSVDAAETGGEHELVWQYPEAAVGEHTEGIGYASVSFGGERRPDRRPPRLAFDLNTTVGDIAASDPYTDYEADRARFRLGPPADYTASHQYRTWVQPPPWPDVRTGYDQRAGRRELVVEIPEIGSGGTITFPVVFAPVDRVPARMHCSVTVQASEPGALGESVRATARGTIDLDGVGSS